MPIENTINVIYDYETLSDKPWEAPVVNLSTLIFDMDRFRGNNPYTFEELIGMVKTYKFDIKDQVLNHNKIISQQTLDWWKTLPQKTQEQLKPSSEDRPITDIIQIMRDLSQEVPNFTRHWNRGTNFDHTITAVTFTKAGLDFNDTFKYGMLRDVRTYIDGNLDGKLKSSFIPLDCEGKFEAHNSIHDIAMDVMRLQKVYDLSFN